MKFINLSPTVKTGEPNTVDITNKKIDPKNAEGTKFTIPAEKFSYPQIESLDEFTQLCGNTERVLEVINDHLRDSALTEGKNRIRIATSGSTDDIIEAGINAAKNFTFIETISVSAGEAKEKLSALKDLASRSDMNDAELAAKLKEMFGIG